MQSFQSVPEPPKLKSTFLLTCSIINICLFPICIGLEIAHPFLYQGIWGTSTFFIAGLVGFSASYTPKRSLLFTTLVFSSISIVFTTVSCILSGIGYSIGYRDCIYVWNYTYYYYEYVCGRHYNSVTQMVLLAAVFIALSNNLIITILCSKQICNCCKRVDSSIPIVVPNPTQPTSVWIISPTGQQQQLQQCSYSTVVYLPHQQQPMQEQERRQAEHTNQTDPASPPPYSAVNTMLEPELKKENI